MTTPYSPPNPAPAPPGSRRRIPWALAAIGAMVASMTALAAPAAHAQDAPAPTLRWAVSEYFANSFSLGTHDLADGATEDENGVVAFPESSGSYDPSTGAGTLRFDGRVTGKQVHEGQTLLSVTFEDPTVSVDTRGGGTISAVVSATAPGQRVEATRVVVTTFSAGAGAWVHAGGIGTLSATPHWDGVLPAGSAEATALGLGPDEPVDGQSFAPGFLGILPQGIRAFFYSSGSSPASDARKAPATFTAQTDQTVQVDITSQTASGGVTMTVDGTGFTGVTNPGDDGVYLGVAPAGGLPDVSDREGMAAFVAQDWVPAAAMAGGTFSRTLTVPTDKLDFGAAYSVYTWQAHAHSNTSQDTETPVAIDFGELVSTPTLKVRGPAKARFGTAKKFTVEVTGAAGPATGKVTLRGAGKARTKKLAGGKVRFALPRKLGVGKHRLRFAYHGDRAHRAVKESTVLKVTRGKARVAAKVVRKPKAGKAGRKAGRMRIRVMSVAGAPRPGGKVRVVLTKGRAHRAVQARLKSGKVVVRLPRLSKGTWKVKARYLGSARFAKATKTRKLVVRR